MATLVGVHRHHPDGKYNSCAEGPFKATNLWNNIIMYLKKNVDIDTRKHRMKTFENCFVGSDAVDVILEYLRQEENNFQGITREKVTKLCMHFLERKVIIDAESGSSDIGGCFEDSTSHFYRFYSETTMHCPSHCHNSHYRESSEKQFHRLKRKRSFGKGKSMKLEFGPYQKQLKRDETSPISDFSRSEVLEGIFAPELSKLSSPLLRRSSRILGSFRKPKFSGRTDVGPGLCTEEKDEIWQEVIVQRLLHLMEIPILENILSCSAKCYYGQYFEERTSAGSSDDRPKGNVGSSLDSDPWIKAAIRCIENQMDVISIISHCHARAQELDSPDVAYKIYLFKYVCEVYSLGHGPFVPVQLLDIIAAILGALATGKTSRAIELSQICLLLVGNKARDNLRRLFGFMVVASDSRQVRLEVKTDNRVTILNSFTSALVNSTLLSHAQCLNLVSFWLDCHTKVFKVPLTVQRRAQDKITAAEVGLKNQCSVTFCDRISTSVYEHQKIISTQAALKDMTNHIVDDISTNLCIKKQHLKNLKKFHPEVYDQYFSNML